MKKALLPLVCFLMIVLGEVKAQWVTIPDTNFVAYLQFYFPGCMNGNQMDTTCSAVVTESSIICSNRNIADLEGVQYFDNLKTLQCDGNKLTSLPPLPKTLRRLLSGSNPLTSLPTLPDSLNYLNSDITQLTGLPSLPDSLTFLACGNSLITSLPSLPAMLKDLFCGSSKLTALPPLPASLRTIRCHLNQLTSLPALPDSLFSLDCGRNQISSLPALPNNLSGLTCNNNLLTNLPSLPAFLTVLNCPDNYLTSFPALPSKLTSFSCHHNQLTSLPPLPQTLTSLFCNDNQLTELPPLPYEMQQFNIYNNPGLLCMPPLRKITGSFLDAFRIHGTGIKCLPNKIIHTGFIPSIDTMPICGLFNDNGCELGWNIQGSVFLDQNDDCVQQSGEQNLPTLKINLYQADSLVQSAYFSRNYSFDTDLSTYKVSIDTTGIPFEVKCPATGDTILAITPQDSLKYGINFGLGCKSGFDVGAWSIFGNRFRPAWVQEIKIKAGDFSHAVGLHCADGVAGTVNIAISGLAKYISPASGALTPDNVSGNSLTYNIADFGTVNSSTDFNIIIRPDTTAQAGELICFTVSVTPTTGDNNPGNNVLTQCFEVRTSYDPNDKAVYPDGDILPEQDWLTYTIRFQNTGNDTAIHIQIIDTLDSDIDIASFKLLAYSHPNITQILEGGIVKFNFPNIMLPDSHVNEPLSHGYIQYKVKLKDNLPIGTQIKNTAYIYFDFNAPVVTNTTLNTISTATAVSPLAFGEGPEVRIYPNPATHSLTVLLSGSKEATITITNLLGETLFQSKSIGGRTEIDISQWPQGMYFVNQQKFVKQ